MRATQEPRWRRSAGAAASVKIAHRAIARATVSAAAISIASAGAGVSPVAKQKMVSPSYSVCAGRTAPASVVATSSIRWNRRQGSRGPSVVVVETAEHWNRDDLAVAVVVHRPIRDSLPDTLMRSGLVEIADILPGDVFEVLVVE
jgi:hypothetical protein